MTVLFVAGSQKPLRSLQGRGARGPLPATPVTLPPLLLINVMQAHAPVLQTPPPPATGVSRALRVGS